jgi:ABC-type nitrate/sulfonate/bicarbonate transport system substrate-binding protein
MKNLEKVSFPYRAASHLILLHVISESGAWEKHGLDVNYDFQISSSDAHSKIPTHEVEFVGGNHVSTYAARAHGDNWVYLGQTVNHVHNSLVVRADSGMNSVADIRGKKLATSGAHPMLNDWLFLKQNGLDLDRDNYEMIKTVAYKKFAMDPEEKFGGAAKKVPLWQWVADKRADACFITPPATLFAKDAGLKVIELDPFPMIWFTTVSSSLTFVQKHPDLVERFLKGIIEGIHFFKTNREKAIQIIEERYTRDGKLDRAKATIAYDALAPMLSTKLFPQMDAISNVYQEAVYKDKDALKVNPMELWDFHHVREIADSGFIDKLYGSNRGNA